MAVKFHGNNKTATKLKYIWPTSCFEDIARLFKKNYFIINAFFFEQKIILIYLFLVKKTINNTPVSNISILNVSVSQPTPGHISLMRL